MNRGLYIPAGNAATPPSPALAYAASLPRSLRTARVMASPPTVTMAQGLSAATLPRPVYAMQDLGNLMPIPHVTEDLFTVTRMRPGYDGTVRRTSFGAGFVGTNITLNAARTDRSLGSQQVSFLFDGAVVELLLQVPTAKPCFVRINDEYVSLAGHVSPGTNGSPGNPVVMKIDFGTADWRRIDILSEGGVFLGCRTGNTDTVMAAPQRGPRVVCIGDSFLSGPRSWAWGLSDALGWDDIWSSGIGGSSYVSPGSGINFADRLDEDVIAPAPDIVWFVGSLNDNGQGPAAVGAAAASVYQRLKSALPNTLVIAGMNVAGSVSKIPAAGLDVMDAIRDAAVSNGVYWRNPVELPFNGVGTPPSGVTRTAVSAGGSGAPGGSGRITVLRDLVAATNIRVGSTIELGTGARRERLVTRGVSVRTADSFWVEFDGTLRYAHPTNEPWREVGPSFFTGIGNVGSPTGFGNADRFTTADAVHPTDTGSAAHGMILAKLTHDLVSDLALRGSAVPLLA